MLAHAIRQITIKEELGSDLTMPPLTDTAHNALALHVQLQLLKCKQNIAAAERSHVFRNIMSTLCRYAKVCKCWRKEIYNSTQFFREMLLMRVMNVFPHVNCSKCFFCNQNRLPCCNNIAKKQARWMCASALPRLQELQRQRSMLAVLSDNMQHSATMSLEHSLCIFLWLLHNVAWVGRKENNVSIGTEEHVFVHTRTAEYSYERRYVWFRIIGSLQEEPTPVYDAPCLRLTSAGLGVFQCDLRQFVVCPDGSLIFLTWKVEPSSLDNPEPNILWHPWMDDDALHLVPFETQQSQQAAGTQTYRNVKCLTVVLEAGQQLICMWRSPSRDIEQTVTLATTRMRRLLTRSDDGSSKMALEQAGIVPAAHPRLLWEIVPRFVLSSDDDEDADEAGTDEDDA